MAANLNVFKTSKKDCILPKSNFSFAEVHWVIVAAASEPEANERGSSLISRRLHYRGLQSLFFTKREELWLCANRRFRMRSGIRKELWLCTNGKIKDVQWYGARSCGYAPMDDVGCAVNHVLSCHCFRFLLLFFRSLLGYLKDSNAAAHSVGSDIFYVVINLCAFQVFHYNLYFLK